VELAILHELLTSEPDCRLVTLVGPKGSGKTWLAERVAKRLRRAFPDGVRLVRLAATLSVDRLPAVLSGALDRSAPVRGASQTHLLEAARDKEMLLVLDGFDHLLSGADLIDDLLWGAPGLKLLITSRVRLNLRAEWVRQTGWVQAPFAKELGRNVHLEPLGETLAWEGLSCPQSNTETMVQTSQVAGMAGW
jgi:non-specific serine/threonine protein kinase